MKKPLFLLGVLLILFAVGYAVGRIVRAHCSERVVVVLSTNDIHARIRRFPQLASAVAQCRDTLGAGRVVLVDAGDRWTGNAYVDLAPEPGQPVLDLMNRLGYDVATLGNHEFDRGQAALGRRIAEGTAFPVVCANVRSDTCSFPQLPAHAVLERDGVRIGVVGVVTNYEGPGHPAGNAASFVGLRFPDPQQAARDAADALRGEVDVLLLLSHMGDDRDLELLASGEQRYDAVIGGHTHVVRDTTIGRTLLTQTGKNLAAVGATTLRLRGRRLVGADFRLVPLDGYAPDNAFAAEVARCYDNPELNRPVGDFAAAAGKTGLGNWICDRIAAATGAEIGIYHVGGVRVDTLPAGGVGLARLYDLEPFSSRIARVRMTPEQLRRMILLKYNDGENRKEAHRIDLIATTPYTIVVDAEDRAVDVRFPALREGRAYEVALGDYIFRNYAGVDRAAGGITERRVVDVLFDDLRRAPVLPDNAPRQRREPRP